MKMKRPWLLDLFCGAGGAARGYQLAGYSVVGVDIVDQPHYAGDLFVRGDALDFVAAYGSLFDAIHASPPCQFASQQFNPKYPEKRSEHQNLIPQTRAALQATGLPYVIENVKGARKHLINPLMLHGSMFDLPIFRERYFEVDPPIWFTSIPRRDYDPVCPNGTTKRENRSEVVSRLQAAMGIDWMTKKELRQAIPPAYTEFIGNHLIRLV
jgi:hypothetical protein